MTSTQGSAGGQPTPTKAPPPTQPKNRYSFKLGLWILAVVAATALVVWITIALLRSTSSGDVQETPGSISPPTIDRLEQLEPCASLAPDSNLGKELRAARKVIVDGRCDPDPDAPVGAYPSARQAVGRSVAQLRNGTLVSGECTVDGQEISNQAGASSKLWIRFGIEGKAGAAYIPAIWVQGEQSLKQC